MARQEMERSSLRSRVTTAGRHAEGASRPASRTPTLCTVASPLSRMTRSAAVWTTDTWTAGPAAEGRGAWGGREGRRDDRCPLGRGAAPRRRGEPGSEERGPHDEFLLNRKLVRQK